MYLVRVASHWFFVKLFFVLFFVCTRTLDNKDCPEEITEDVVWPSTSEESCSSSEPVCINNKFEVTKRCCLKNQTWDSNPTCSNIQDLNNPCPNGSFQRNNVCIFVIKSNYPPNCPYEETLPFKDYIEYVDVDVFPIWLPVQRITDIYGEGMFYWTEVTQNYGDYYSYLYHYKDSLIGKKCLIFYNESYIEASACTENHSAICAYTILNNRDKTFCSQAIHSSCKQSDYSTKSKCFCQKNNTDEAVDKIELLVPYQNLLYTSLDEICYIGLEKRDDSYIWTNSNLSINYTYWSSSSEFGPEYLFGAMSSDGWLLKSNENEENCTLIEKPSPATDAKINLLEVLEDKTIVAIPEQVAYWKQNEIDSDPIILCFTDVYNDSIIQKVDVKRTVVNDSIGFELSLINNGPGNYWCEGFLYPDLQITKSNIYFERPVDPDYVIILSTSYLEEENPLSEEYIKRKYKVLVENMASLELPYYPRIYKIVEVNETNSEVFLNVHLTTKTEKSLLQYYPTLRSAMQKLSDFSGSDNLLSTTYCIGGQTTPNGNAITWPTIQIGQIAPRPRENWCLNVDGSVITRSCEGNFIDGASYAPMEKTCYTPAEVKLNLILNEIVNSNNPTLYLPLVIEVLLTKSEELQTVDISLISEIFKQLSEEKTDVDIQQFTDFIGTVVNIDKNVLQKSDQEYNSTDKIVDFIGKTLEKSKIANSKFTNASISIIAISVDEFYSNSVFWTTTENTINVEFINVTDDDFQLSNFPANFNSGLIFNKTLLNEIATNDNTRIIIVAYFKSSLFNEPFLRYTSTIFNTIFPDLPISNTIDLDNLIVTVYKKSDDFEDSKMFNCSYWTRDTSTKYDKGYWHHKSEAEWKNSEIFCNFTRSANIGLVESINITTLLEDYERQSANTDHCASILNSVKDLLMLYALKFSSTDIAITTRILSRCEVEIELVSDIFNEIIDLSIEALKDAERILSESLLDIFDQIYQTYEGYIPYILRKNFAISFNDMTRNLIGFYVEPCENFCMIHVKNQNAEEVIYEINFTMSDDLIQQLIEEQNGDKIIFVVFSNNALFLTDEDDHLNKMSKVAGILTKVLISSLIGEFSVDYHIENQSENHTCESWLTNHWNPGEIIHPLDDDQCRCEFWSLTYNVLRYNVVNVTYMLEKVVNSNYSQTQTLKEFSKIINSYKRKFIASDIDIVANYLSKIVLDDSEMNIVDQCANIVTNVMDFDHNILNESEYEYLSLTKFRRSIENVAKQINISGTVCSDKLIVVISSDIFKMSGIIIKDIAEPCNSLEIVDNITEIANLGIVVTFANQELEERIIFIIYLNNSLFIDQGVKKNTSLIYGVHVQGYFNSSRDIQVYYNNQTVNSEYAGCVNWKVPGYIQVKPTGSWELTSRISNNLTCSYYQDGYFTIWENFNITSTLIDNYISSEPYASKLKTLEIISTFYENFKAADIFYLSQVLLLDVVTPDYESILKKIGLNYFKIPSIIKQQSQIYYNATSYILEFIYQNRFILNYNLPVEVENYFQIILCDIAESGNTLPISETNQNCFETHISSQMAELEILPNTVTTLVSVFKENDLFVDTENSTTSKIIGISLSEEGPIKLKFNQSIVNLPKFACGSWEFVPNQNGKWRYAETEKDSFETICTISNLKEMQYIALIDINFTKVLEDISSSYQTYYEKIEVTLKVITVFRDQFQSINVNQIYEILQKGELIEEKELYILIEIINELMDLQKDILAEAQDRYNTTENLLSCIDRLIQKFEGEVAITNYVNFAVVIKPNISGLIFENSDQLSYTIKKILYGDEDIVDIVASNTTLIIENILRKKLEETSSKLYISVYFNNALFNGRTDLIIKNEGIIVGVGVSDASLRDDLKVYFENYQNQTNICGYWTHIPMTNNTQTGYWETTPENPCENRVEARYFALLEEYSTDYNVTSNLQDILNSNAQFDDKLEEVIEIVRNNTKDLGPYDIFLISEILGELRNYTNTTKEQVNGTSQIISKLFEVNKNVLEESQVQYNATDSLLYTTDEVIRKYEDELDQPLIFTNFTIAKIDVKAGNITSLIINECTDSKCDIFFVNDKTLAAVAEDGNFKTALVFSNETLNQIKENEGPVYLMITIYFHDNFFNENPKRNMDTTKVLGVILEGLNDDMQGNILLMYNVDNVHFYDNKSCAYWKYQVVDHPIQGYWQNEVSPKFNDEYIICEYDHLTHFVLLLASSGSMIEGLNDLHILDILTNINSVLSLLGLFGIFLTTIMFDRWRNNTGNQILINFSVAISIKNVMLYISEGIYTESDKSMACTITGGILHYSILSEFCWMLIIAVLQFKRFVEVLGGPLQYVLLKACICGWVFPALPVFLIIIIDINNYNKSEIGLCYPSGFGLYLGIWLPLLVIITINFIIFIFILFNVFHKRTEYRDQVNHDILFQWRLAILLFSMLGLTWSFGFLALAFQSSLFAILFCFLATLQGFIMFLFFIVFNKNTRYLYVQCFSSWMYSKGYKNRLN